MAFDLISNVFHRFSGARGREARSDFVWLSVEVRRQRKGRPDLISNGIRTIFGRKDREGQMIRFRMAFNRCSAAKGGRVRQSDFEWHPI